MKHSLPALLLSTLIVSTDIDTVQATPGNANTCVPVHFAPGRISVTGHEVFRGVFSSDRSRFLFFRSLEGQENYGIFESILSDAQEWTEPARLVLGKESSDFYPSLSLNGMQMVFSSYRASGPGGTRAANANFWVSDLLENGWSEPKLIKELSTPDQYDNRAHFLNDGTIRFSSISADWAETHEYVAKTGPEGFSAPSLDGDREGFRDWIKERPGLHLWTSDLSPDGQLAVLEVSKRRENGRPGPADLWIAQKTDSGWSVPKPVGAQVNTKNSNENFPTFTSDSGTMTFVRDFKSFYQIPVSCPLK